MKVYLVLEGFEYEGSRVVKVFAHKEDAELYKAELVKEYLTDWEYDSLDETDYYVYVQEKEVF